MDRTRVASVAVCTVLALLPAGAWAQNLLVNPDFDTDVAPGWTGLGSWDPVDYAGSPSSGSATWLNDWSGGGSHYLIQCVEIADWIEGYLFAGFVRVASGQPMTGDAYLNVMFHRDATCSDFIGGFSTPYVDTFDAWQLLELEGWTPTGAGSAEIALVNTKPGPGDFQTFHDGVFFGPDPSAIFGDSFQSADVAGWTSAVGYPFFGAYDSCVPDPCNAGMDCMTLNGVTHHPTCLPQCESGGLCPGREGVAGSCALAAVPGPPTHCALLCDPGSPDCPIGMECFDLGGGGVCLWPSP